VLLVVQRVGEGVDIGGQAGRRRGVYAGDMVVDANLGTRSALRRPAYNCAQPWGTDLLGRRLDRLLDQMNEVGRAEFSQCWEGLGASLNGRVKLVFVDPVRAPSVHGRVGGQCAAWRV
jgi:hypothetical protein